MQAEVDTIRKFKEEGTWMGGSYGPCGSEGANPEIRNAAGECWIEGDINPLTGDSSMLAKSSWWKKATFASAHLPSLRLLRAVTSVTPSSTLAPMVMLPIGLCTLALQYQEPPSRGNMSGVRMQDRQPIPSSRLPP